MHVLRLHSTANVICIRLYRLQPQLIKENENPAAERQTRLPPGEVFITSDVRDRDPTGDTSPFRDTFVALLNNQ